MKALARGALAAALAFAFAGASGAHAATVVIDSTVVGGDAWGYVQYIHPGGDLTIDIRASGWEPGPGREGIPDPYIEFYVDDGSSIGSLSGALVGFNDDSPDYPTHGDADGSTVDLDPFLQLSALAAGNYILAIGNFVFPERLSNEDARDNAGSGLPPREAGPWDYRVTFTSTPAQAPSEVPVPAALPLFVTGLVGLGLLARRRKRKQVS
jgi:hypothetical protein